MKRADLIFLAGLRLLVGYLGEQDQFNWWNCSFFSPSSKNFLEPVFGKTSFLVQYYGVKEAAAKVHDNYIGVSSGVFHLFRLPESIEQELHALLNNNENIRKMKGALSSMGDALKALESCGANDVGPAIGPSRIGSLDDIERKNAWQSAARLYSKSFELGDKVFPFYSGG